MGPAEGDMTSLEGIRTDPRGERRDRRVRAVWLWVLTLFVFAGAAGAFGIRSGRVASTGPDGTHVEVTYPRVARPGLAVPLEIVVHRDGGFDEPIEVSVRTSYLQAHDHNVFHPTPSEATVDGERTRWTYDPPAGETLKVWIDHRIEPGVRWGREGDVRVAVDQEVVDVTFTTWIFP